MKKKSSGKVCKNTEYKIKKQFFHAKEVIKWHEATGNKGLRPLDVSCNSFWKYTSQFEHPEIVEDYETEDCFDIF
jgi:hypothetical protein